jgi:hypothetical protein
MKPRMPFGKKGSKLRGTIGKMKAAGAFKKKAGY